METMRDQSNAMNVCWQTIYFIYISNSTVDESTLTESKTSEILVFQHSFGDGIVGNQKLHAQFPINQLRMCFF